MQHIIKELRMEASATTQTSDTLESKTNKPKGKLIAGIVAAVIVVAVIVGGVFYYNHMQEVEAHNRVVYSVYDEYVAKLSPLKPVFAAGDAALANSGHTEGEQPEGTSGDSTEVLLQKFTDLGKLAQEIEANADSFRLYDGTLYKQPELLSEIAKLKSDIANNEKTDFQFVLDSTKIPDVNAEGVTKDSLNTAKQTLADLKNRIATESQALELASDDAQIAALNSAINEQIAAYDSKVASIEEEETKARAASSGGSKASSGGSNWKNDMKNESWYIGNGTWSEDGRTYWYSDEERYKANQPTVAQKKECNDAARELGRPLPYPEVG